MFEVGAEDVMPVRRRLHRWWHGLQLVCRSGAFIKTLPTSGAVGTAILILGTSLTGATTVTFNGTPAAFTVVSATEIATTVPSGATSGKVQVTTPGSTYRATLLFM